MKRVLVLGAGLVARPLVRYFLALGDCRVEVASLYEADAGKLIEGHPRGAAVALDVSDAAALARHVRGTDLVVSLVPPAFHPHAARAAIAAGSDLVTTSYVSPEMRALDGPARAAGVTILNEIGLDPGLDHLSALRLIRRVEVEGGRVVGFTSACGVLPAPEAATSPWRYKFSWSPRGVLSAARQPARYRARGITVDLPPERVFDAPRPFTVEPLETFEIYPNRDSLPYVEAYGLREPRDMLRATIRYPGWSETMRALGRLGLLEVEARSWSAGSTYRDLVTQAGPVAERLGVATDAPVIERLRWVGLLSDEPLAPSGTQGTFTSSPLDLVVRLLERRLAYAPGERDMVVLQHETVSDGPAGERRHRSRLVCFGEPGGDSATARTVSLPAAVAGHLLLEGRLDSPGVSIPTSPEIAERLLARVAPLGITFEEHEL